MKNHYGKRWRMSEEGRALYPDSLTYYHQGIIIGETRSTWDLEELDYGVADCWKVMVDTYSTPKVFNKALIEILENGQGFRPSRYADKPGLVEIERQLHKLGRHIMYNQGSIVLGSLGGHKSGRDDVEFCAQGLMCMVRANQVIPARSVEFMA